MSDDSSTKDRIWDCSLLAGIGAGTLTGILVMGLLMHRAGRVRSPRRIS